MTNPFVFISYSQQDEAEKNQLLSHLGVLQREGLLRVWSDDQIGVGSDWQAEVRHAIKQARVAILLVSKNFLNSDFILDETVPTLLQRREGEGLKIFPVIAKPCAWRAVKWLTQMKIRPSNGDPVWREDGRYADEELTNLALEVAKILDDGRGHLLLPPNTPPPPMPQAPIAGTPSPKVPTAPKRSYLWMFALGGAGILLFACLVAIFIFGPQFTSGTPTSVPTEAVIIAPNPPTSTYTPSPSPSSTPIPAPTLPLEATFGEITFAEEIDSRGNPIRPGSKFARDIPEVYAIFSFSDMSNDDSWERIWYLDDKPVARTEEKWQDESYGIKPLTLTQPGIGQWRLELYINGKISQVNEFTVE